MRLRAALLLFLLTGRLTAWGGTPVQWHGGTLPWDTFPYKEADLELYGDGGDGFNAYGVGTALGLQDWLQAGLQGRWGVDSGTAPLDLSLQIREPYFRGSSLSPFRLRLPPLGAYGRWRWDGARWQGQGGVIIVPLAFEDSPLSFVVNLELDDEGTRALRMGFWSHYILPTLRLGLDAAVAMPTAGDQTLRLTPQALFNAPGDLSASIGAQFDPSGRQPVRYSTRLSWILFPSP